MRIISKFKDYYDKAMQYGSDPLILFVRNTGVLKPNANLELASYSKIFSEDKKLYDYAYPKESNFLCFGMVFFCGNGHPFIKISQGQDQGRVQVNIYGKIRATTNFFSKR